MIFGGETYSKHNAENADLLNDVWYFDLHLNLWKELKPLSSNLFKRRSNFSIALFNEDIYVFGGLKSIDDCTSFD